MGKQHALTCQATVKCALRACANSSNKCLLLLRICNPRATTIHHAHSQLSLRYVHSLVQH